MCPCSTVCAAGRQRSSTRGRELQCQSWGTNLLYGFQENLGVLSHRGAICTFKTQSFFPIFLSEKPPRGFSCSLACSAFSPLTNIPHRSFLDSFLNVLPCVEQLVCSSAPNRCFSNRLTVSLPTSGGKREEEERGENEVGVCGFNVSSFRAAALQRLLSQGCCLRLF